MPNSNIAFMKNSILSILAISLITGYFSLNTCGTALAQAPQGIPYQAIARNSSGQAIASTAVRVRFSIRDSIATGVVRYQETHNPTTSALGLFSVNVGMGTVVSGSFSGINWGKNAKFLQIELDPAGGTAYTDLGTTQLMSVPYALHSNSANTATTASNGVPAGGSNGQVLTNCNGVAVWTTGGVCPGAITALNCAGATNSGTLTSSTSASGVSSSVPYTGGNGGTYTAQTITSTGVTGLTATLAAGTLLSGAGSLTYTITGTPATSGTASFALSLGGQTCTLTRTVALPVGTITTLICSTATNTGTLTQGIAAASVSSSVPYTGGNGGTYTAQTITSTGVTGLTATLPAGTLLIGVGSLTYTITGTPATSGTAIFALSLGGQTCSLTRTVIGLASLSTSAASVITSTTASSGGNITADGGAAITARGVCWSTSANPTIALSTKTSNGTGTGTFSSSLTGLTANTFYYVRSYATNSVGTVYGNQVSFSTATSSNPTDADGNVYNTVTIGNQLWMKENLKTSKYRNGDPIPTNLSNFDWQNTTSGAYAIYNNDVANNATYGKLYNWYAVADSRNLCPVGWHVPSDAEWTTLINFLGGIYEAGGKLKSTSSLWTAPNTGATNESGFSGLPGGVRNVNNNGNFTNFGTDGAWWSSSPYTTADSWYFGLSYSVGSSYLGNLGVNKAFGFSVRCLRD